MTQTVQLKRSSVASKVPTTSDLALGEIAINTYDGKLFIKKDDGVASIVEIGAAGGIGGGANLTFGSNSSTFSISSDSGTDAIVVAANSTNAGALTADAQTIAGTKTFTSIISGSVDGNSGTAIKLQTARTINGVSFDGSANINITAATPNGLTIGSGLSGTSFDGSTGVTIAIDSSVATLTGSQTLTNKTISGAVLTNTLNANSSVGSSGQVLTSSGSGVYWSTPSGGGGGGGITTGVAIAMAIVFG